MPISTSEPQEQPEQTLPELFYTYAASSIDGEGFGAAKAVFRARDGDITMAVLDLPPDQVLLNVLATLAQPDTMEVVFGMDRFTKPDQGTEFADVLTGAHLFKEPGKPTPSTVPFVINYRPEPRLVRPYDWENQFWNNRICLELVETIRRVLGAGPAPSRA